MSKAHFVSGVKIRVYHVGCGQYTIIRHTEPKGERVECPICGKLTGSWVLLKKCKIDPKRSGSYWKTTVGGKMSLSLRDMLRLRTV